MQKSACIFGVNGQDGTFLSEQLLEKGYKVTGIVRRSSTNNLSKISNILDELNIVYGDITDQGFVESVIKTNLPDEIYNLAAMSFVPVSWSAPVYTMNVNSLGQLNILEAVRTYKPDSRIYFAASSECFGKVVETPQNENTPFYPRSPYGVSKVTGFWLTKNYRESYNMFACSGIAFNHESELRSEEFVTKKITKAVANIFYGKQKELFLGNISTKRDWSYAGDITNAMQLMLQNDKPVDYVIGSGENHSVEEFCELAFGRAGLNYKDYVKIDPKFFRPAEVDILLSDPSKIKAELGWTATKSFQDLVFDMVDYDLYIGEIKR
jgi:GDPmannose 4,6-dehydratase